MSFNQNKGQWSKIIKKVKKMKIKKILKKMVKKLRKIEKWKLKNIKKIRKIYSFIINTGFFSWENKTAFSSPYSK